MSSNSEIFHSMSAKRILIVEDDDAIRQMLKDVLEIAGYELFTAADGKEGIEALSMLSPSPCLILLDMMMPGTNGWDFLDYQRSVSRLAGIPVIVCSAYKESAKTVKPSAFIEKPIQLNTLLKAIRAFCE